MPTRSRCTRSPSTLPAVPIGCARLLPDGHIGRVAVLARWRRRGVGSALLLRLVDEARGRGDARVMLNAQVAAMPFYARHGFVASGDVFDEAGIAHRVMERAALIIELSA